MSRITALIDRLDRDHILTQTEYGEIIKGASPEACAYLYKKAETLRWQYYGHEVYVRGLIEFTNYCRNDCFYCGIRCSNRHCDRYRLTKDEILACCREGYALGYRTFVLQGGEDPHFSPQVMADIVASIREMFPDCAITLSVGEQAYDTYALWKRAGANRYLLRHETADKGHYESLHPKAMSFDHRRQCLRDLKSLGYQVGCGFMVGSPGQTEDNLARELIFLKEFQPDMVGIGPFIPQKDTPFGKKAAGTLEQTLLMLALIRLTLPEVLLPSTTALGTIHPQGRELGIKAGANVCMPNLSPTEVRKKYLLYDNKICTGDEAAEGLRCLSESLNKIGYRVVTARGDRYGL